MSEDRFDGVTETHYWDVGELGSLAALMDESNRARARRRVWAQEALESIPARIGDLLSRLGALPRWAWVRRARLRRDLEVAVRAERRLRVAVHGPMLVQMTTAQQRYADMLDRGGVMRPDDVQPRP